jgi:hypothetical protein
MEDLLKRLARYSRRSRRLNQEKAISYPYSIPKEPS